MTFRSIPADAIQNDFFNKLLEKFDSNGDKQLDKEEVFCFVFFLYLFSSSHPFGVLMGCF